MGAEGVEADVEAGGGSFGAGARIGNVVELVEERVLQRCGNSSIDVHAALRCGARKIDDD